MGALSLYDHHPVDEELTVLLFDDEKSDGWKALVIEDGMNVLDVVEVVNEWRDFSRNAADVLSLCI